jgi:hypothetical protein
MPQRYRTKGKLDTTAVGRTESRWDGCSNSNCHQTGSIPLMAMGEYTMMYDSINPGFRRAIKDGKVFMNPMSKVTQIGVRRGGIGPQRTQLNAPQNCSGSIQYPQVRDVDNQIEVLYSAAVGQGFTVGRLPIMADLLGSSISRALT